eukprot:SAG31_NODE_3625_length_4056_cov_1.750126_3_plen_84_part_00
MGMLRVATLVVAALATAQATPQQSKTRKRCTKPGVLADPRFGEAVRERLLLREGFTQFNHGSFGVVPSDVMEELHRLQVQCET